MTRANPHSRALWHDRAFRLVWGGQTVSLFGDQVNGIALPWLILLQTRSPLAAGLVLGARNLPLITLGLFAGVLADRASRRVLMILYDAERALTLGMVAALGLAGLVPPLWLLTVVVVALGAGQLLFQAAYRAWLPDLTGEEQLSRATTALEASDAASVLAGYPLGGALIAAIGPGRALGADALLRVREPAASREHRGAQPAMRHLWAEALAGVRFIPRSPAQRLLRGSGAALYLAGGIGVRRRGHGRAGEQRHCAASARPGLAAWPGVRAEHRRGGQPLAGASALRGAALVSAALQGELA